MKKSKITEAGLDLGHIDLSPSHLLHRVLQIALDIYTTEVGEGALTQRQFALLKALEGSEGMSQSELVKLTGIDRSTMADMVARMMAKGLLDREKSTLDARANLVRPSLAGRTALIEMKPKVQLADEQILGLIPAAKRENFVKLLRKIVMTREGVGKESVDSSFTKPDNEKKKTPKKAKSEKKSSKSAKKHKKLPMPQINNGAEPETKS